MEILQELDYIVITVTVLCCCSLLLACLKDKLERQIIVNTFGIQVIGLATLNISLNKMVFQILFDALLVLFFFHHMVIMRSNQTLKNGNSESLNQ